MENSANIGIAELLIILTISMVTPLQSLVIGGAIVVAPIVIPTYLDYAKSSYASEARTVMSNINNASKMYYQTTGQWPSEVDELERAGQLDVSRSTKLKWTFDIQLSDWGGRITATSTEEMSGGAGHQIIYDADRGKFSGYGSPEGE